MVKTFTDKVRVKDTNRSESEAMLNHVRFGDDSPILELLLNGICSVAMFQRVLIKGRWMEGIALAKR